MQREIPTGPWGLTWLVAGVVACAGVGLCEWSLREARHRITIVDDPLLWDIRRRGATGDDTVALVGTSRLQLAFSSKVFAELAPAYDAVNLTIDGVTAAPILDELAADETFHGLVICDVAEWELDVDDAQWWLDQAKRRAPGAVVNRWLATLAQSRLVVLSVGGRNLLVHAVRDHAWPPRPWLITLPTRDRRGDYRSLPGQDLERLQQKNRAHLANLPAPLSPDAWLAATARLDRAAERIAARGGRVVFVRMPAAGVVRETTERQYPRAEYWDRFAAHTRGIAIHTGDVPGWADLDVPDDVHLNSRSQEPFTRALVDALRARGVLR